MRPSFTKTAASLALGVFFACASANAGEIIMIENPDDFWGIDNTQSAPATTAATTAAPATPATPAATAQKPEISAANSVNVIEPSYGAPSLSDMQILGRWVGNVQYKVGSIADRMYVISPNGQIKRLPINTEANNVVIPENSPVVQRMSANSASNDQTNDGPTYKLGQTGLLKPTVMGTRTTMVDGKPVIVGGAIISELQYAPAPFKMQQKTFSRVYTKRSLKSRKRVSRK